MNAAQMRAALAPRFNHLDAENSSLLKSFRSGSRQTGPTRRQCAKAQADNARQQLTEEAMKLGLATSWFAWLVLKWVISQLVQQIARKWLNETR